MTHNTRSSFIVSASTGATIAGVILSAAIISGAPAAAGEAQEGAPSRMPPLIYSPSAEFCAKGSAPGAEEVCFKGSDARLPNNQEANEGPPTDPKVFAEQQKKLREDLQKRADELRKRLESQDGNRPSAPLR